MKENKIDAIRTLQPPTEEIQAQLPQVAFIVEATAFERDTLYLQHRENVAWRDCLPTRFLTIGQAYERPVSVRISISVIHGLNVMFVEPFSELFDHVLLTAWLDKYCSPMYENSTRKARTDARNFRDCLRNLRELNTQAGVFVP